MSGSTAGPGVTAEGGGHRTGGDDRTAERIVGLLRSEGVARTPHAGRHALLDHLIGTYEIVRRWNQPLVLQHAALIHSVYGTDVFKRQSLPLSRRDDVIKIAGSQAERLAYLFSVIPRDLLFAGTHVWAPGVSTLRAGGERDANEPNATRAELDGLVLLHMANLAEQSRSEDESPGRWLVRLRDLAELLIDSEAAALPLFVAELAAFSEADESMTGRLYRAGTARTDDLEARASRLALTAAACPVVPEPCIWLAHLCHVQGDRAAARLWARWARRRLLELGTPWDKRLTFAEWLQLAETLERSTDAELSPLVSAVADPRALFDALTHRHVDPVHEPDEPGLPMSGARFDAPPDATAGPNRFHRYVDMLGEADGAGLRGVYPDLESQPWFNASDFPLAVYLESHYDAIRDEILALDASRFHRESERIARSGDWDVAFLYERGRRHEEVCDACPVVTRGIETYPAMRTAAGLIYASRMRAGSHIQAHRGPTNLRLRCHLAIKVPDGDCAIRVGDQTQPWREGECLVFDDHFEHEAWNHTGEDRIVLIIDMWHPGLSAAEVGLLEGLHRYVSAYARQLNRYWSSNAAAAGTPEGR